MSVTVLNPNKSSSNSNTWGRSIIAFITSDQNDARGEWDFVVIDAPALTAVVFTLPSAGGFPGKHYDIVLRVSGGDTGTAAIFPAGSDTVNFEGEYDILVGGDYVSLVSDGISNWIVRSRTTQLSDANNLGTVYVVPGPGTPLSPSPSVPRLDSTIKLNNTFIPPATAALVGGVEIVGTPPVPATPKVPVIESGPFSGTITTGSLVGKTITVVNGVIVSFA
jgi:hypothetical protein